MDKKSKKRLLTLIDGIREYLIQQAKNGAHITFESKRDPVEIPCGVSWKAYAPGKTVKIEIIVKEN